MFQYHLGRAVIASGGSCSGRAILDEDLGVGGLSQDAKEALRTCDIAYMGSHGAMDSNRKYRFRLRQGEWIPTDTAAEGMPAVLVLDTCDVVTKGVDAECTDWVYRDRPSPALVLGFTGPATDGHTASQRGRAFAAHLDAGETFVDSWFNAIDDTQPARRRDRAVAIAFGPTDTDARTILDNASLNNIPKQTVADRCVWKQV